MGLDGDIFIAIGIPLGTRAGKTGNWAFERFCLYIHIAGTARLARFRWYIATGYDTRLGACEQGDDGRDTGTARSRT